MSLFHSAFDTPGAGSSKPMSFGKTSAGKKKGKASLNDDQLRATAVNVQKLMEQVERGEIAEKATAGSEPLGHLPTKKKRRGSNASHDEPQPAGKKQKKKAKSALAQLTAEEVGEPAPKLAEAPKGKKNKKNKQEEHKPAVQKAQPKAKATEGLTKMQQQMANKLEGARFRWINEQLYTTPSTEAVAMMKKEPKIFEDVSHPCAAIASPRSSYVLLVPIADRSTITRTAC